MAFSLDVNVLLFAADESSPRHRPARDFLERCARGSELMCLAWPTLMSYLRMATHPRIFASPLTPGQAEANVASLLALPNVRPLAELDGFWEAYRSAGAGLTVRANTVPDTHLAAILLQNGIRRLYTHDADFRRFTFLEVLSPFEA